MGAFLQSVALLLGRILICAIFLGFGTMKIPDWAGTTQYMTDNGIPSDVVPYLLPAAIAVELGCGLFLLFGFFTRPSAFLLAVFLIPATLFFHNFWVYEGRAQEAQLQHFMKNLAIMGGLFAYVGAGAGVFSLDALRARRTL